MKNFILIACFMFSLNGLSQEPFGKRFSVSLKQGFSMVDYISTKFVGHNRLSVNCVFGKNFMIGIDGNYGYARYKDYMTDPDKVLLSNWEDAPQIRDLSVGASLYYFRDKEGGYAPTGRYFFVSASYGVSNKLRVEEEIIVINAWNENTIYYNYLDGSLKRKSAILAIGFGRNFIINKRILLGYSLDFGLDLFGDTNFSPRYIMRPSIQLGYTF